MVLEKETRDLLLDWQAAGERIAPGMASDLPLLLYPQTQENTFSNKVTSPNSSPLYWNNFIQTNAESECKVTLTDKAQDQL